MKLGEQVKTIPTIGFNVEKVKICKGLQMAVWDVGGQDKLRQLWKHYYQDATGMYMVYLYVYLVIFDFLFLFYFFCNFSLSMFAINYSTLKHYS